MTSVWEFGPTAGYRSKASAYLRNLFRQHPLRTGRLLLRLLLLRLRLRRVFSGGGAAAAVGEHVGRAEAGGGVEDARVARRGRRHRRDGEQVGAAHGRRRQQRGRGGDWGGGRRHVQPGGRSDYSNFQITN